MADNNSVGDETTPPDTATPAEKEAAAADKSAVESSPPPEADDGAGGDGTTPGRTASGLHLADSDGDENDVKSHTFRQRRLTYTKHHLQTAAAAAAAAAAALEGLDDSSDEEKEQKGGQNAAAATQDGFGGEEQQEKEEEEEIPEPSKSEPKSDDQPADADAKEEEEKEDTSPQQPAAKRAKLTPRVLHASAPPRKLRDASSLLYQHQQSASERESAVASAFNNGGGDDDSGNGGGTIPAWKKRRFIRHSIHEDVSLLPFPRDVVGTYSCHGVEPLYDSDYEQDDDDEDGNNSSDEDIKGAAPTSGPDAAKLNNTVAKINQDRGGVAFPYGNCPRTALFAAYDGHGEGGESVAQFALHEVQRRLEMHADFKAATRATTAGGTSGEGGEGGNVAKAFRDTFVGVDDDLQTVDGIEPLYAGATACVVLLRERTLTIANAGDSRAVLARLTKEEEEEGKETEDGRADSSSPDGTATRTTTETTDTTTTRKRIPIDLSVDQNPDSPGEQQRIEASGGYVSPPPEPGLSARVWLDRNFTQIGLAMSRSIGDHAVKSVGVIAEPVVTTHTLTDDDDFMIIATDGVWEFVESEEAVRIVSEHLDRGEGASRACQCLIEAAAAKWHDYEGDYRDDITALVVTFKGIWDHSHSL